MKRGETATFNPSKLILRASDHTLDVISALYVRMAQEVFGMMIPADTFKATTKAFRLVQSLFPPSGLKHNLIGRVETLHRPPLVLPRDEPSQTRPSPPRLSSTTSTRDG